MVRANGFITAIVIAGLVSACSLKVSDKSGDNKGAPGPQKGVQGPNVEGHWMSGCEPAIGSGFRKLDVTFTGNQVVRNSNSYRDSRCTLKNDERTDMGTFIFLESHPDGTYTIEYTIPMGDGWSAMPQEKVLMIEDSLYISDFVIGDTVTKESMIQMKKQDI